MQATQRKTPVVPDLMFLGADWSNPMPHVGTTCGTAWQSVLVVRSGSVGRGLSHSVRWLAALCSVPRISDISGADV